MTELGDLSCQVCATVHERSDLDRLLWCEDCLARARLKARKGSLVIGLVVAGVLAAWIFGLLRPTVIVGGWIGVVLGGFWVGARVGREVLFAIYRARWSA
jgi:hypothetical protein